MINSEDVKVYAREHNNMNLTDFEIDTIKLEAVNHNYIQISYLKENYHTKNATIPTSYFKEYIRDRKIDLILD